MIQIIRVKRKNMITFEELYSIIKNRKKLLPKDSYTVSLLQEGEDKILQKIGEEAVEVIIAGKNKNKQRIIEEIADLYYMVLILLVLNNIPISEVFRELEKRRK